MFLRSNIFWEYRMERIVLELLCIRVYIPNKDILQGYFRLCDWLFQLCLGRWIND